MIYFEDHKSTLADADVWMESVATTTTNTAETVMWSLAVETQQALALFAHVHCFGEGYDHFMRAAVVQRDFGGNVMLGNANLESEQTVWDDGNTAHQVRWEVRTGTQEVVLEVDNDGQGNTTNWVAHITVLRITF